MHHYGRPKIECHATHRPAESRPSHAYDRKGVAIQCDRLPNDVRISLEALLPERMAEHDHRMTARALFFIWHEGPPDPWAYTKHLEEVGGDHLPPNPFRFGSDHHAHRCEL